MKHAPELPARHIDLLELLYVLAETDADGIVEAVEEPKLYAEVERLFADTWELWRDDADKVQSDELRDDVEYLHRRGYLFQKDSSLTPTPKARYALEAVGRWASSATLEAVE